MANPQVSPIGMTNTPMANPQVGPTHRYLPAAAAAAAKPLQSCPTLCDPTDGSPPGSPDPGILQARTLEWGAIAFSEVSPIGMTNAQVWLTHRYLPLMKI